MRLFTCKKYDFLIEKNLPSLPASHSISRPIESEIEFIFPATQNQGKLRRRAFLGVALRGVSLTEDLS